MLLRLEEEVDMERDWWGRGCERDMLLRLLAREVERCCCWGGDGGGPIVTPGASAGEGRMGIVTGLRDTTGAGRGLCAAASFFAASASSMRLRRSSFLRRSFSAMTEPGSSNLGFVGAFVDFARGAMVMLVGRCFGAGCSSSLFRRSSFCAFSFSAIFSPGS